MNWDDLRYFLELARTGTLTAAARRLEVQHSTVARRIARMEREQGQALFEREAPGYQLTRAGRALMLEAERIASAFERLQPSQPTETTDLSGTVRISCTEGFANYLGPVFLRPLKARHPEIVIELLVRPRRVQIPRNEADITINIDRPERGPYLVTRLLDYRLGLYATRDYLEENPEIRTQSDLRLHRFVSYVTDMEPARDLPMAEDVQHAPSPQFRSSSLMAQRMAVLLGCGIAVLPDFLAQTEPRLQPVLRERVSFQKSYYMSVAQDQRAVPRIAAVWDILKQSFTRPPV